MYCFFMYNGVVGIIQNDCTKVHGRGVLRWMCYVQVFLGYCDKCNYTKLVIVLRYVVGVY